MEGRAALWVDVARSTAERLWARVASASAEVKLPSDPAVAAAVAGACGAVVVYAVRRAFRRGPAIAPGASAAAVASALGLIPHPEGGFFLETFRAGAAPMSSRGQTDAAGALVATPARAGGERNSLTSIYYMLTRDSPRQWWANNVSDHVHYWHGGGEVIYRLIDQDGVLSMHTLGPLQPQLVVRGGCLKCAQLAAGAEYALLGEAVAPGFDFRDFKFVSVDELAALVPRQVKGLKGWVKPKPETEFGAYYGRKK